MGVALQGYVSDFRKYPYYRDDSDLGSVPMPFWEARLQPYYRSGGWWWTNDPSRCPAYDRAWVGIESTWGGWHVSDASYAYNRWGTVDGDRGPPANGLTRLGLGNELPGNGQFVNAVSESEVKAPSEMFAFTDSRVIKLLTDFPYFFGLDYMLVGYTDPKSFYPDDEILIPRHGRGYNVVACDDHVILVKRAEWIDPRKTGRNWNNDHEPHPETWH